eukprot:gene7616-8456_t
MELGKQKIQMKKLVSVSSEVKDEHYDEQFDLNEERTALQKYREERENELFPDEVDTPVDVPARIRFQRYRGLKSFRSSPWDPKENLPNDYSRIFRFADFKKVKNHIHAMDETQSAASSCYITIYIDNVPSSITDNQRPFLTLFGLLPHEQKFVFYYLVLKIFVRYCPIQCILSSTIGGKTSEFTGPRKMTVMHFIIKRHYSFSGPVRSKFERFLPQDGAVVVTVFAPTMFPPSPVMMFSREGELIATGTVYKSDPGRVILKKVVLSGHPFKINKKSAVLRHMFFNRDDILWFKPVELYTKFGRRGTIKEPLGTHGHMKCVFDGQLKAQDTRDSIGLRSRKVAPLYCKKHGKARTETLARRRDDSPDFTQGDLSLEEQSPIEGGVAQPAPVAIKFLERLAPLLHDLAGTVRQSAEMQADSNARLGCKLRDWTQKTVTPESQVAELLANLVKTNKTKCGGQQVSAFQSNSFSKPDDFFQMKKELREIRESLAQLNEQGHKEYRGCKFDGPNQQKERFEMRQTQGPKNDSYQPARNRQGKPVCYQCGGSGHTSRSCLTQYQQTPGSYSRPNGYGNSAKRGPRNNYNVNMRKETQVHDNRFLSPSVPRPNTSQGQSLLTTAYINELPAPCLIDTGADISILGKNFWDCMPTDQRPVSTAGHWGSINTVSGEHIDSFGSVTVLLRFNEAFYLLVALVADVAGYDAIIGLDFLTTNKAIADIGLRQLTFQRPEVRNFTIPVNHLAELPFYSADVNKQIQPPKVSAVETITMPPFSELLLDAKVQTLWI